MARKNRRLLIGLACLLGIPLALFLLLLGTVLAMGISKDIRTWKAPEGLRADAGHLDPAKVGEVIAVPADSAAAADRIRAAIAKARARRLKIAISGARPSMGGQTVMAAMTRELIDAALGVGGTYYLPYRLHATPEQFARAYPMAAAFFALKSP